MCSVEMPGLKPATELLVGWPSQCCWQPRDSPCWWVRLLTSGTVLTKFYSSHVNVHLSGVSFTMPFHSHLACWGLSACHENRESLKSTPVLAWDRSFCTSQRNRPLCSVCQLREVVMLGTRLQQAERWSMSSDSRHSCSVWDCATNQMVLLIHPIPSSTCESSVHPGLLTDEKFIFNKY